MRGPQGVGEGCPWGAGLLLGCAEPLLGLLVLPAAGMGRSGASAICCAHRALRIARVLHAVTLPPACLACSSPT